MHYRPSPNRWNENEAAAHTAAGCAEDGSHEAT